MLISLNWVRLYCNVPTSESPVRLGERFSLATAEVESVQTRAEDLGRFIVARVLEVGAISGAKKLRTARVDVGGGEPVTVVCGAPNVREGLRVPFAAPGTVVQGQKLEKAKIFGVESSGMLLSEREIGLSDDHEGILELDGGLEPGTPLSEVFPAASDVLLEVDNKSLTHRPDLWGHYGIAREFSTIYDLPLAPYEIDGELASAGGDSGVRVSIDGGAASERCRRYCGLRIDGVEVGPSPAWLAQRLLAVGSRPINNIVDVTNYVLFDLGQPLHAFDTSRLRGSQIRVRMPSQGETMTLLDGRQIELHAEDLLIADGEGPVALAGVMGGDGSQIHDGTTSIFLESANFEPNGVRRTSLRHGRTDSSARFEKSLDPEQARLGILRAAALILELCPGARVVGPLQDAGFTPPEPIVIDIGPWEITGRLGCDIADERIENILTRLGFRIDSGDGPAWRVTVPSWRATRDVSIAADLVEEVGRIHGYDNIEPFAPVWPISAPPRNERRDLERVAKQHLSYRGGLGEVMTYSLVGSAHCEAFGLDPAAHLELANPLNEDQDRLRREIVPQHLEKAAENQRFADAFGFYELGRVYRKPADRLRDAELPDETTRIAGILAYPKKDVAHFYELRHLLVSLVERLERGEPTVRALANVPGWAHPHVAAQLDLEERTLGALYRVHPETASRLELRGEVLAFDIDFEALAAAPRHSPVYRPLPRFPSVPFDVSVLADERQPVGDIARVARDAAGEILASLEVFGVYQGEGIEPGKKSVSFHLVLRSADHTLDAEQVEAAQSRIIKQLEEAGYPLR